MDTECVNKRLVHFAHQNSGIWRAHNQWVWTGQDALAVFLTRALFPSTSCVHSLCAKSVSRSGEFLNYVYSMYLITSLTKPLTWATVIFFLPLFFWDKVFADWERSYSAPSHLRFLQLHSLQPSTTTVFFRAHLWQRKWRKRGVFSLFVDLFCQLVKQDMPEKVWKPVL